MKKAEGAAIFDEEDDRPGLTSLVVCATCLAACFFCHFDEKRLLEGLMEE
jgi:hypothetical protein